LGAPTKPGPGHRPWSGEDAKDFIYLSIYTGLRISDVSTFNIAERPNGNDLFLRMHKTKKELYTWIPDWLVNRLRDRENKCGALIFRSGEATNMRAAGASDPGEERSRGGPLAARPSGGVGAEWPGIEHAGFKGRAPFGAGMNSAMPPRTVEETPRMGSADRMTPH
jgi:hypothetical protein